MTIQTATLQAALDGPSTPRLQRLGVIEPIQLLILQSTAFCNIDCGYCYLPGRDSKARMSLEMVERIADEVVASPVFGPETLILWHAGEPLVVPIEWYRSAHRILQSRAARPVRFQFQTNATLIDEAWAAFFAETGSNVTISIDGPADLHDLHRTDRRGKGTHSQIMRGAGILRAAGVPFSTIAVVTRDSLARVEEIFAFFQALQPTSVGFSTEEAEGANVRSSVYEREALQEVEQFFARLTALNLAVERPLRIREVEHVLRPLREGKLAKVQNQECALAAMVTIATDGTLAFFSPEHLTTIREDKSILASGSLAEQGFAEILNSAGVAMMAEQIALGVEMCRESCQYFRFCGGGAPSNKYWELGRFDGTETWHCRVTKQAVVRGIIGTLGRRRGTAPMAHV